MNEETMVKRPEPDPFRKEWLEFWREIGKSMLRGSLARIDAGGRQIITVDGVLAGLYLNAIAFSDLKKVALTPVIQWILILPVVFLAVSLFFALIIFLPDRERWSFLSAAGAEAIYRRSVSIKWWSLWLSLVCLLLCIVFIGLGLYVYLVQIPAPPNPF